MFLAIEEIIDIVIMALAIGYIFSSYLKREPAEGYDPLKYYSKNTFFENLKQGIIIAAPAIVLHELSHKFTAMAFGYEATLHAPILLYIFVIFLRLINFPLLFFVGGYVTHPPMLPLESALVSFAGPLMNLLLYLVCLGLVKFKLVNRKHYAIVGMAGKLNLFLCLFNLIPLPGFDGYNGIASLIRLF